MKVFRILRSELFAEIIGEPHLTYASGSTHEEIIIAQSMYATETGRSTRS
jgi:hypothetical protein